MSEEQSLETVEVEATTQEVDSKENASPETEATEEASAEDVQEQAENVEEVDPIAAKVEEEVGKVKAATQKRIDRLTAQLKQKEKAYEDTAKRMQEIEARLKPQDEAEPSEEDFDTFEEFDNARAEFKAEKLFKQKEAERARAEMQKQQQEVLEQGRQRYAAMEQEFRANVPEYDENAEAFGAVAEQLKSINGNTPTLQAIGQVLVEVDGAPALVNHLGQNEDLAFELADMSPVKAAFRLFELQKELTSAPQAKSKPLPEPVKPVKANGKTSKPLAQQKGEDILKWVNS